MMNKVALFNQVSYTASKVVTRKYSTSFSLGIYLLDRKFHDPIYGIYGFVRLADEIVDTFHDHDKATLLKKFEDDAYQAIDDGISLNPILNAFQDTVNTYNIERSLIERFIRSMRMDLEQTLYSRESFEDYIIGSAEVVGLMCLRVFTKGQPEMYDSLAPAAMRLGAAFQKINFLRDLQDDFEELGRAYFPSLDVLEFNNTDKRRIEEEIAADFSAALEGIRRLPSGAKRGVFVAYVYYKKLFDKIKSTPADKLLYERVRIPNGRKMTLMVDSLVRVGLNAF